ncbi:MAG: SWF/SNF helicase family protein, partial [Rudanella sp.]|nr:SWF/SNF helicase family protein [Rudanella sp.]
DMINDGREDELLDLVTSQMDVDPTMDICIADDFEPGFYEGLKRDQRVLNDLSKAWADLGDEDPKLDTFVQYITNTLFGPDNREKKLVVFSESKETTEYVARRLKESVSYRILTVDSRTRKDRMPTIRANFDANLPADLQQSAETSDRYDIIISTEVLAEGVNLHRANVIVNYDTPWNATRLMQRIGRVNRIGTKAKEVLIYNFFPTAQVDSDIELQKKAMMKLQAFHAALGEDSQIYSPDEVTESFGLFDKDVDEERDEKLDYLMQIRDLKEKDPDLFKRIRNMPLRARVGRKDRMQHQATIAFIRDQKRDAFLYTHADGRVEELTFLETAKRFQCMVHERAVKLHDLHHEQVQVAVARFRAQVEAEKAQDKKVDVSQGPNERKALTYLDAFLSLPIISDDEKTLVGLAKEAIRRGRFQNLQRDINKLQKSQTKVKVQPGPRSVAILLDSLLKILNSYPLSQPVDDVAAMPTVPVVAAPTEPAIIISESFSA